MFIKNIFEKNFNEEVHLNLLKYSKGEFCKKLLIETKKSKDGYKIKTGPEFANYFVKKGLELAKNKLQIKGIIVSTNDLNFPFSNEKKQFMGIKQYKIEGIFDSREILDFLNKNPKIFFALSFSFPGYELKIKPKMPKSPKPSNKIEDKEDLSPDFCSLKTTVEEIIKDLLFDVKENFNEIMVEHRIVVNEIVYPTGFQKMKPEEIREKSKRKGKIIRRLVIDGKERTSEAEFIA